MINSILIACAAFLFHPMEALSGKDCNYCIKKGYLSRDAYFADDETKSLDECQDEVYKAAFDLTSTHACQVVADVGCGSGFKLLKYFKNFRTIGFEVEPNYSVLKIRYPENEWYFGDFNAKVDLPKIDLIVCADVIEHLVDPDLLLNWIQRLHFEYFVLSTPDRDRLPPIQRSLQTQTGPPVNPHHVREWNFEEFEEYIGLYFDIVDHFHLTRESHGQVIIARPRL